jgi:malate dehydrogenase (oxaloacetate-decarboxylating)(NADP+)
VGKSLDAGQARLQRGRCGRARPAWICWSSWGCPKNIWVADIEGVVYEGRTKLMDEDKARFAQPTSARTLADLMSGADVFLGLSAGGVLHRRNGAQAWRARRR